MRILLDVISETKERKRACNMPLYNTGRADLMVPARTWMVPFIFDTYLSCLLAP